MTTNQTDGDWADQLVNGLQQLSSQKPQSEESKMTDDNYQPNNLEEKLNGASPSGTGNTQYQTNTQTQTAQPVYSHEAAKQEHARGKSRFSEIYAKLRGKENFTVEKVAEMGKKTEETLQYAGVPNIDRFPDVVRPYYVKAYNLVKGGPTKRFKDAEKDLDSLLSGLEEVRTGLKNELFGAGYVPMKTPPGGLYGKQTDLASKRKDYSDAVIDLTKEITSASERLEQTKQEWESTSDPELKKNLTNTVIGITFDINQYEQTKEELLFDYDAKDLEIKATKDEIMGVKHIDTYVGKLCREVRQTKAQYRMTSKNVDYTGAIMPLLDDFGKRLADYRGMATAIESGNRKKQEMMVGIANIPIEQSPKREATESPFSGLMKEKEGEGEAIMARIMKTSKDPFGDLGM